MTSRVVKTVTLDGREHRQVQEGLALILAPYQDKSTTKPKKGHNNDEGAQSVFYNPIQQFNRDLSVLAILIHSEGAVLEKEAKWGRKTSKKKKGRRPDQNVNGETSNGANSNKRKANELEGDEKEEAAKRARVDKFEADEDEMEVLQLNGETVGAEPTATPAQPDGSTSNGQPRRRKIPFTILDALSASGIRAMRYAKEIPLATTIVANDLSPEAVRSIERNALHNGVQHIVNSNLDDARAYMYSKVGNEKAQASHAYVHRFDVIDLDPYGTAVPFLDAAVQAIQDGGLLCVTCTDAGVFASNGYPEKAFALYGGIPPKGPHSHEAGLRLIINSIAMTAAKYGIAVEPLLSLSIDFYARVFVRIHKSQQTVKLLAGNTMMVYNCDNGCGAWTTQSVGRNSEKQDRVGGIYFKHSMSQGPTTSRNCEHCDRKMHIGGPLWAGPIHNPYFIQRILDRLDTLDPTTYGTLDRIRGMLTVALEEDLTLLTNTSTSTETDSTTTPSPDPRIIPPTPPHTLDATPLFFIPNYLAKVLHCSVPSEDAFRGAIRHLGYKVTRSHCKAGSIKTNAPFSIIWEIMREWVRQKAPIKEGKLSRGQVGWEIMRKARDSERYKVDATKGKMIVALEKAETTEDLRNTLAAAMYRLDHDGHTPPDAATDTEPATEDATTSSAAGENETRPTSQLNIVFDEALGKEKPRGKLVRYQINPRANWGPMNRAGGGGGGS